MERVIVLELIDPPSEDDRLERSDESIHRLAASIQAEGLINPVTVEAKGERYECVAGWTRCLALRWLQHQTVRAIVHEPMNQSQRRRIRFAENIQRENLSPIEEAARLHALQHDEHLSIGQLATLSRRSEAWVTTRLELLDIPEDLQSLVHSKQLALASALALAKCKDDTHRSYLTQYAMLDGATVEVVRSWVRTWEMSVAENPTEQAPLPPMPPVGQPVTIMMSCARCFASTDHRQLRIVRICPTCSGEVANATDAAGIKTAIQH